MAVRRSISAVTFVALLLAAGSVLGQTPEEEAKARKLFKQAEVHFNLQEFQKALDLYSIAYKINPLPGFLFNIGQCQRYLGKHEEALFSYKIYLVRVPNPPNRALVEQLIEQTERRIAQQKAQGGKTVPKPDPQPDPNADDKVDDTEEEDQTGPRALWVWTGVSVSAALVATGVVTGQLASNRSDEYKDPQTTIERRRDLKDSGERLRTASVVTLTLGGLTAVGTVIYYYLGYRAKKRRHTGVAAIPLTGGGAITFGGEF